MIKGGTGGGNTKTGLFFEGKTDLATFLNSQKGYKVEKGNVYFNDELPLKGNCMEILNQARENSVEALICADPPYFFSNGGITCHAGKWFL